MGNLCAAQKNQAVEVPPPRQS